MPIHTRTKFRIVRYFRDQGHRTQVIKIDLTEQQAQDHCNDPETSSRTCTTPEGKSLTEKEGDWFDGYQEYPVDVEGLDPNKFWSLRRSGGMDASGNFNAFGQPIRLRHLIELLTV